MKRLHPEEEGWTYMFWDNERSDQLIASDFPEYAKLYHEYKQPIKRTDAIRFFVLKKYGGVYCDVHFKPIKNIGPLLHGQSFVAAVHQPFNKEIANAFMASVPNHPLLDQLIEGLEKTKAIHSIDSTGPKYLTDHVVSFNTVNIDWTAGIYDRRYLYPTGYWEPERGSVEQKECLGTTDPIDKTGCIKHFPEAFLVKKSIASWSDQF